MRLLGEVALALHAVRLEEVAVFAEPAVHDFVEGQVGSGTVVAYVFHVALTAEVEGMEHGVLAALAPALLIPGVLLSGFAHEAAVIALGEPSLRLVGLLFALDGVGLMLMHALLGAGAARRLVADPRLKPLHPGAPGG